MKEALRTCRGEPTVSDLGSLFAGLLLVVCVWALGVIGCASEATEQQPTGAPGPTEHVEFFLADGTRCLLFGFRGTPGTFRSAGVSCQWGCPR